MKKSIVIIAFVVVLAFSGFVYRTNVPLGKVDLVEKSIELPPGCANEWQELDVEICNLSNKEAVIVGGTSDCSCVTLSGVPVSIARRVSASVRVRIKLPDKSGQFKRQIAFVVNDGNYYSIGGSILGSVREQ